MWNKERLSRASVGLQQGPWAPRGHVEHHFMHVSGHPLHWSQVGSFQRVQQTWNSRKQNIGESFRTYSDNKRLLCPWENISLQKICIRKTCPIDTSLCITEPPAEGSSFISTPVSSSLDGNTVLLNLKELSTLCQDQRISCRRSRVTIG
ncbi:hypothetical protein XENORESO_017769 [Xenotaenia resolanae]|uniref:Uncharacterized protein n=1 Tax=Xenotaenia resolanae TaxID=208358 RepID=A0ABV0W081_9TELE